MKLYHHHDMKGFIFASPRPLSTIAIVVGQIPEQTLKHFEIYKYIQVWLDETILGNQISCGKYEYLLIHRNLNYTDLIEAFFKKIFVNFPRYIFLKVYLNFPNQVNMTV
jgi:hypothetical protein